MVFLTGLIFQQHHAHLDQQSKIFQQGCILIPLAGVGNNLPWVVDRRVGDVPRNARQTDKLCRENKRLFTISLGRSGSSVRADGFLSFI